LEKIDFVIIWVDGGDKEWQKQRNIYAGKDPEDLAAYRFRDWENLKYWFRGVEKFAPWVNNVYFITNGQKPEWLNLDCPKLKWIKHEDYIPKEWLPTFNSHVIEHNFFRIDELSEHFVYFNDDFFLTDNVKPEDFFKDGKPKSIAGLEAIAMTNEMYGHIVLNDVQFINRHFNIKKTIKSNWSNWYRLRYGSKTLLKTFLLSNYSCFTGIAIPHICNPLLKSTMKELWEKEPKLLEETCSGKFRSATQVSQNIYYWYDIARGNFSPRSRRFGELYTITSDNTGLIKDIQKHKYKAICLNDSSTDFDFEKAKNEINSAFEKILPGKSSFEK
jgi:hypothetical protein